MSGLAVALLDLRAFDRIARAEGAPQRLDARAKVLAAAGFLVALASFGRYEISSVLPLALFPVLLAARGAVPAGLLLRKAALGLPFLLALGILLPVLERRPMLQIGPVVLSEGWIAFASLLLRGLLAVATATVLVAVTGIGELGAALRRLGLPRPFVQQLQFLYRYLFLVAEEVQRRQQARALRAHGRGLALREFPVFAGHLLLKSWERAERVHAALLARGYQGSLPTRATGRLRGRDWRFLLLWTAWFAACRLLPLPRLLGAALGAGS